MPSITATIESATPEPASVRPGGQVTIRVRGRTDVGGFSRNEEWTDLITDCAINGVAVGTVHREPPISRSWEFTYTMTIAGPGQVNVHVEVSSTAFYIVHGVEEPFDIVDEATSTVTVNVSCDALRITPNNIIRAQGPLLDFFQGKQPPAPTSSTACHVSASGRYIDQNGQVQTTNLTTIQAGIDSLGINGIEVAYVHDGTYDETGITTKRNGTNSNPLWLVAAGQNAVIRDAQSGSSEDVIRVAHQYWVIRGLEIDVSTHDRRAVRLASSGSSTCQSVVLQSLRVHGAAKNPAIYIGAHHVAVLECLIYDNKRLVNGQYQDCHGIGIFESAAHVLVRSNQIYANSGDSIQVAHSLDDDPSHVIGGTDPVAQHVVIEKNDCSRDFENAIDLKTCRYVTISENTFHDYYPSPVSNEGVPIVLHIDARHILIEKNTISNCNTAVSCNDLQNPARLLGPMVFHQNIVSNVTRTPAGQGGRGFDISAVTEGLDIDGNIFQNIERIALLLGNVNYLSSGTRPMNRVVVINNTIRANQFGISFGPYSSNLVSNCNRFEDVPANQDTINGAFVQLAWPQWQGRGYDQHSQNV